MILKNNAKNKNLENPNAYYWSLLAANGKEQSFEFINHNKKEIDLSVVSNLEQAFDLIQNN